MMYNPRLLRKQYGRIKNQVESTYERRATWIEVPEDDAIVSNNEEIEINRLRRIARIVETNREFGFDEGAAEAMARYIELAQELTHIEFDGGDK